MDPNVKRLYQLFYGKQKIIHIRQKNNKIRVLSTLRSAKVINKWTISKGRLILSLKDRPISEFDITTKMAGRLSLTWIKGFKCIGIHLFPKKSHNKIWGLYREWYDGPIYTFGFGPLFLICWTF